MKTATKDLLFAVEIVLLSGKTMSRMTIECSCCGDPVGQPVYCGKCQLGISCEVCGSAGQGQSEEESDGQLRLL